MANVRPVEPFDEDPESEDEGMYIVPVINPGEVDLLLDEMDPMEFYVYTREDRWTVEIEHYHGSHWKFYIVENVE